MDAPVDEATFTLGDTTPENRRMLFRLAGAGGPALGFVPIAVTVLRNGAYLAGGGPWVEVNSANAPGWYYYELEVGELGVAGVLGVEIAGVGIGNLYALGSGDVKAGVIVDTVTVVTDRQRTAYVTAASRFRQPRSRRRVSGRRR
jgi:hypothetical protein